MVTTPMVVGVWTVTIEATMMTLKDDDRHSATSVLVRIVWVYENQCSLHVDDERVLYLS